jgi:hypothetical protein
VNQYIDIICDSNNPAAPKVVPCIQKFKKERSMKRIVWTLAMIAVLLIIISDPARADWVTATVTLGNGPCALQ